MTRTRTADPPVETSQSGTALSFASRSSSTPRKRSRRHTFSRTREDPSPIPAVKRRPSIPPAAAAIAATAPATRCSKTAYASSAAGSPAAAAASSSRVVCDPSPRPSIPDSRLSMWSSSSTPTCPSRSRKMSAPGSTDPERVFMGTPSSGLNPMVVSTERPFATAVTEQPPPRWQTTSRVPVRPSSSAARSALHSTERP